MFVILVYDVSSKRVRRIIRTAEKYLFPIQESVFEGHLTQKRLSQLKNDIFQIINPKEDSVILYTSSTNCEFTKEQLGLLRSFPYEL